MSTGLTPMHVGVGGVPVEAFHAAANGAIASPTIPASVQGAAGVGSQPMPAPWASDDVFVGRRGHDCRETTKKGGSCRSKAVAGTNLCVGHWRVAIAFAKAVEEAEAPADDAPVVEALVDDAGDS